MIFQVILSGKNNETQVRAFETPPLQKPPNSIGQLLNQKNIAFSRSYLFDVQALSQSIDFVALKRAETKGK